MTGTTSLYSDKGLYNFTDLAMIGEPGRTHTIEIVYESTALISKVKLSVALRKCNDGEALLNSGM